ncbi:S41 family peptidase [Desulforamulus aquiferis]|uniref:S41 family peptidase n=2 Tax=Desulforamulus aquiferis TaxID=1397668 RepID=A0AAW7ZB27_9FIRM|nr:S41 family peptidase [Desulforamulus aquiferis]
MTWVGPVYAQDNRSIDGATTIGEVLGYITHFHLKETGVDVLVDGSIKGIIEQVGDPYTVYFPPGELDIFSEELNGDFEGVGVELELINQLPTVVRVLEGTPAKHAGMLAGDSIIAVDGKSVLDLPLMEVINELKGKKGTQLNITVRREAEPDFQLSLTRAVINLPTIYQRDLGNGVGYIAIDSFGMETGEEFGNALIQLAEKDLRALIIDLRFNGGGYVDAAMEAASYILGRDVTVFITEDRDKIQDLYKTEFEPVIEEIPVVILINDQSASAAELMAGAFQDYGIATLVGTNSYGKGTVQDIIPLQNGGALKMTTAYYLTPMGRSIDGIGLTPDYFVTTPELQLPIAKTVVQPKDIVVKFYAGENKMVFNEEDLSLQGAIKEQGNIYVPLRIALEALGYQVGWDNGLNGVRVTGKNQQWLIPKGNKDSTINGVIQSLEHELLAKNNTIFISPIDLRNLGIEVFIQDETVILIKKK